MENEIIETIKYKGYDINIYPDYDAESPEGWMDDISFLVNYHRDFFVSNDEIITEDDVRNWYNDIKIEQSKKYHIFALSMLSHSGIALSLERSFVCDSGGWDTSHVGIVLVSKKEARTKKKALEIADGLLENWNNYLSGRVYGFMIDKLNESIWGFFGDYRDSGIIDEAKGIIDYEVEKRTKRHLRKLRSYIKNNVSLESREPLETTMFA